MILYARKESTSVASKSVVAPQIIEMETSFQDWNNTRDYLLHFGEKYKQPGSTIGDVYKVYISILTTIVPTHYYQMLFIFRNVDIIYI
jgi:hypothetical protein